MFRKAFILATALATATQLWGSDGAAAASPEASGRAIRELMEWLALPRAERPPLSNAPFAAAALTRADADKALAALWRDQADRLRLERAPEMKAGMIELEGLKMRFEMLSFTNGSAANGRSLFLSMHGGGGAPAAVNDSQWRNQVRLGAAYRPREGLYLAPRAPTDAWNLWHQAHIDTFFDRLIESLVVLSNVNPNRVYLLGYSAGGDGVYQLAPRMADRLAAAAMMGGHPNDASPVGLRNLPFAIQVGANDGAYSRNKVAAEWGRKLDELQSRDPSGYVHFTELHAGKGHWMDLEDRKAIPWMERYSREPLPKRVVWRQSGRTHPRFYWLAVPPDKARRGQEIVAEREAQTVTLASTNASEITVLLNDRMMNLDQPVIVRAGEKAVFSGVVHRTVATLARTLLERSDTNLAFSAAIAVTPR